MTQYKNIPQPGDQRNQSQSDILNNFQYLCTPLNAPTGTTNGILPVDHLASGNNGANPNDGFHQQVSFVTTGTAPTNLTNAVNSQSSNGILYITPNGGSPNTQQLYFYNGSSGGTSGEMNFPISCIKAFGFFTANNATVTLASGSFNVASVARSGSTNGIFTITFTNKLGSLAYVPLAMASRQDNSNTPTIVSEYNYASTRTQSAFTIQTSNGSSLNGTVYVSFAVIGI